VWALPMVTVMPARPVTCSLLSLASVGCLLLIVTVRGAWGWSDSLAVTFYGLVIVALGLSLVGGFAALGGSMVTRQRVFCLAVGLVVPALFAFSTWAVFDFVSHLR
jgi:hypothetical protein